jgi:hypothetical protein
MSFTGGTIGRSAGLWLIVSAVIELALAGVFLLVALTVPFVGEGMLLTAGILGAVGFACLVIGLRLRASAAANDRLLTSGVAGQAAVTGLTQTGMYLNENPQVAIDLLVELPGRAPYPVQRKEFVPLILLGRLSSGAPLPVRVDPADPQRLVIDWQNAGFAAPAVTSTAPIESTAPAVGGTGSASAIDESLDQVHAALQASGVPVAAPFSTPDQGSYTVEQLRDHLRQNGVAATARIDQLMDMGKVVGDEKLYTMQVTLELPGRAPEQLQPSAAMVPLHATPKVKVGWRIPVRVAAENHQLMMFEWDRV